MSAVASPHERTLRASRLFAQLDPEQVHALARSAVRTSYARGDLVWRGGAAATHFTVIATGLVKIVNAAPDGSEAIVGLFGPRESIGDAAVLARGVYPASAVAASDVVEVVRVEAGAVLEAMRSQPEVAASINTALLEHTRALQEKIRIMTAGAVPKRLAALLLHLAERFGDEREDGSTFIPVVLSRTELARLVGATVETTIRAIRKWEKDGMVETTSEGFRVDPAGLDAVLRS